MPLILIFLGDAPHVKENVALFPWQSFFCEEELNLKKICSLRKHALLWNLLLLIDCMVMLSKKHFSFKSSLEMITLLCCTLFFFIWHLFSHAIHLHNRILQFATNQNDKLHNWELRIKTKYCTLKKFNLWWTSCVFAYFVESVSEFQLLTVSVCCLCVARVQLNGFMEEVIDHIAKGRKNAWDISSKKQIHLSTSGQVWKQHQFHPSYLLNTCFTCSCLKTLTQYANSNPT